MTVPHFSAEKLTPKSCPTFWGHSRSRPGRATPILISPGDFTTLLTLAILTSRARLPPGTVTALIVGLGLCRRVVSLRTYVHERADDNYTEGDFRPFRHPGNE